MMQTSSQHEELKAMAFPPFEAQLVGDATASLDDIVASGERKSSADETSGMTLDDMLLQQQPQQQQQQPKKMPPPNGKKTKGRVKIKMEFIDNKLRRYTTFSKRKTGIMKKAYELSTLTGTQVMLLVASETGHVYTFATRKLQPMITSDAGKALIQTCLNSPDPPQGTTSPPGPGPDQRMSATGFEETDLTYSVTEDSENKDSKALFNSLLGGCQDDSDSDGSSPDSPPSPKRAASSNGSPSPALTSVLNSVSSASSLINPDHAPIYRIGGQSVVSLTGAMSGGSSGGSCGPAAVVLPGSQSSLGTLMYQTPQGLLYAAPGGSLPEALLLNLTQPVALKGEGGDGSTQQYITIPVPVSMAQQQASAASSSSSSSKRERK
ncbi:serum response factor blistered isoform X4 [Haemaphysalis longicornis]